jgi:ATP-dependent RNA helicase DDX47/RRP3
LFSPNVIYVIVFVSKGIVDVLCEACEQLRWKSPTTIQKEAIPVALQGIAPYS